MNTRSAVIRRSTPAFGAIAFFATLVGYILIPAFALERWRRRQQASEQLAHVDAHILQDAGISEARRFIEVNRPD